MRLQHLAWFASSTKVTSQLYQSSSKAAKSQSFHEIWILFPKFFNPIHKKEERKCIRRLISQQTYVRRKQQNAFLPSEPTRGKRSQRNGIESPAAMLSLRKEISEAIGWMHRNSGIHSVVNWGPHFQLFITDSTYMAKWVANNRY